MKWLILTGSFMSFMASAGAAVADSPVAPNGIVFIEGVAGIFRVNT
jgi:hypothetical protein